MCIRDRVELIADPSTATPSAPPTMRATSFMAEPTPALAKGTAPITEFVDGAITFPIKKAASASAPPTNQKPVVVPHHVIDTRTVARSNIAPDTALPAPCREQCCS